MCIEFVLCAYSFALNIAMKSACLNAVNLIPFANVRAVGRATIYLHVLLGLLFLAALPMHIYRERYRRCFVTRHFICVSASVFVEQYISDQSKSDRQFVAVQIA